MNLKVKSKKINDFTYELSISAAWKDIKSDFESSKKKVAKETKISGFRKGKIPENILMSQYLPNVELAFIQDFCEKYYILSLQKEKLNPINQANLKDIDFSYENDLSFKAEFEIEPKISLPRFKKDMVSVEKVNFISNDKEVEDTINNILMSQSEIKKIDKGSEDGDFMLADFQEIDSSGISIIGQKTEKKFIAIGQEPITGANKEVLLNKNVGDEVRVNIDSENGNKIFKVSIHSIERRIPPKLDKDFVKKVDPNCDGVDQWKTNIKESIQKEYEKKSEEMLNSGVIDQFIKMVNPILPPSMFDSYLENIVNEVKASPQGNNLDDNTIKEQYKTFAENNLKWFLMRKTIIQDLKFEINNDEIETFIANAIKNNQDQKTEIERFYKKESNRNKLSDDLLDSKVLDLLKENSEIVEKDMETSDLHHHHNH
ncbi:MAG: trigger factor [Candidatus Neomarinimicrobiota bacterium]|nr:trigger factor [Candidatus Neomarinimicrobiota bacterium]